MKIAVNTPTGHIGRRLARILRDTGEDLVLLVRDPAKVEDLQGDRVQIVVGNLEDGSFVTDATRGVDALFWVTPPNYATADLRAFQQQLGRHAAAAVSANGIGKVVHISSLGAQHAERTGPVKGLHDVEGILNGTDAAVTHLRAGYFMENYLWGSDAIHEQGAVFMPCAGATRVEMIATADIAAAAARILREESWTGARVVELAGPRTLTFAEAATIIGQALQREVRHVRTTPGQSRESMGGLGLPDLIIDAFLEMYAAIDEGLLAPEGEVQRTPTTLAEFAREQLVRANAAGS